MNIEELNKSQLLLLTILVNFITSIATGILTVSLLDEAPPIVTQTVNRIVEQTVQTISQATSTPTTVTKETTVVDKQQDLVVAAIAAQASRTVQIYTTAGFTSSTSAGPLVAIGTYLPKTRAVVTAAGASLPAQAVVVFPDGSNAAVSLSHTNTDVAIYGFADNAKLPVVSTPALVASSAVEQGETVIALTSDGSAVTGIVSRVDGQKISTTLPNTPVGSAAVDLDGNLVGISSDGEGLYISAVAVTNALTATSTPATNP